MLCYCFLFLLFRRDLVRVVHSHPTRRSGIAEAGGGYLVLVIACKYADDVVAKPVEFCYFFGRQGDFERSARDF